MTLSGKKATEALPSAESAAIRISHLAGILIAVFMMGALLYFSATLERLLKKKGLNILSKLTGLFLAALASQLIFTGIRNMLFG